ncbi:hypothetical protein OCO_31330 [Mycobacterium intracellulare MOTT-02]|uniref:Uncharacterized protein n=1 Tax=Mycobacterium intracellulare (strain ATCC 13950 / DSM 43223 / JCM 6384 / NCTC 13025 / 3600) TaxID=487521 RepID=H8ISA3_MYCIA|nr:hypothetical protein OCU_31220 [Mycobacterium intracellulare ATCC 13950]AFC49496.1 hypothetical protein OCO_31330 [Mycobacterium intracellulare MOTT-02]ETZ34374.1 hypothetical protein L843_3402 [Mycobacterium intracellulare MIN_061107_1834]
MDLRGKEDVNVLTLNRVDPRAMAYVYPRIYCVHPHVEIGK